MSPRCPPRARDASRARTTAIGLAAGLGLLCLALGGPAAAGEGTGPWHATAENAPRQPSRTSYEQIAAARRKAQAARKAYEDARDNSTPDDWVYVNPDKNPVGLRRFPKPEYQARLEALERKADEAERELERLERESRLYP